MIVLTNEDTDDAEWRAAAYEQFLRDDPPEDVLALRCQGMVDSAMARR